MCWGGGAASASARKPDRDGQYFHYLAMWLYALAVLGRFNSEYRERGVALARDIHRPFVVPGRGVLWKLKEDLSGPYPGYGFGALDAFDGYVSYRLLDETDLVGESGRRKEMIEGRPLPIKYSGNVIECSVSFGP